MHTFCVAALTKIDCGRHIIAVVSELPTLIEGRDKESWEITTILKYIAH